MYKYPALFFYNHGHIDHVGALANHVAKRRLFNIKKASYYNPPELVQPLQSRACQFIIRIYRYTYPALFLTVTAI
jgi:hypothetical protein